jgi:NAD(P)-dependent dehydrogenase (short-subunit alcohol dehydrogenase family)
LGSSIIKAFFESNATVISLYLNGRETGHTQTDNKSTSKVQLVKANVTDEQEGEKLVSNILDKNGRIDILVNMVGAYYLVEKIVAELEEKE